MIEKKGFVELTDYWPECWNNMNFPGLMKIKETGKALQFQIAWSRITVSTAFLK